MLSLKRFAGFDLSLGVLCSIHLISTFLLVSPMYFPPKIHIPSYILHAGCNDLPLRIDNTVNKFMRLVSC